MQQPPTACQLRVSVRGRRRLIEQHLPIVAHEGTCMNAALCTTMHQAVTSQRSLHLPAGQSFNSHQRLDLPARASALHVVPPPLSSRHVVDDTLAGEEGARSFTTGSSS